MKYWKYLKYVLRHKWFVMVECFRMGLIWRGLAHDMSKFLPSEWFPYMENFYGEKKKYNFSLAWLYHQHRNPHHWQYWILRNDRDKPQVLEMPGKYVKEMLADWKGAGRAIRGGPDNWKECNKWYNKNKDKMELNDSTRFFIELFLKKEQ